MEQRKIRPTDKVGWGLPKRPPTHNLKVTLIGNRVFADEIRSCWIKSSNRHIFKREGRDYHRYREDVV